jgi:hypothetical protein
MTYCVEDRRPVLPELVARRSAGMATGPWVAVRYLGWLPDRARNGHAFKAEHNGPHVTG